MGRKYTPSPLRWGCQGIDRVSEFHLRHVEGKGWSEKDSQARRRTEADDASVLIDAFPRKATDKGAFIHHQVDPVIERLDCLGNFQAKGFEIKFYDRDGGHIGGHPIDARSTCIIEEKVVTPQIVTVCRNCGHGKTVDGSVRWVIRAEGAIGRSNDG